MVRTSIAVFMLLTLFVTTDCGRERAGNRNPALPPQTNPTDPGTEPTHKIKVYLFGAGYCVPCKHELPQVQNLMDTKLSKVSSRILTSVYVIAGDNPGQIPTQQYAEDWGKSLGVRFQMKADKFAKVYRSFYTDGQQQIPAAVILSEGNQILKQYVPGELNMDEFESTLVGFLK